MDTGGGWAGVCSRRSGVGMVLVVVAGLAALSGCGGSSHPSQAGAGATTSVAEQNGNAADIGPFLPDPNDPTKPDTHWHAALGVFDCDHWMGDTTGSGIWNWPTATPEGAPARASNPGQYAGLHSHDDGVIHMEPAVPDEVGTKATLGRYFDFGGWKVSPTGFTFLGITRENGDSCGASSGTFQWATASWDGTSGAQKYVVHSGDPAAYKLLQGDIVVLAFLPPGKSIPSLGEPPSVKNLANALNVEAPPSSTAPVAP